MRRFAKVSLPFELRLRNGMNPPVPEVTVLIHKIVKDRGSVKRGQVRGAKDIQHTGQSEGSECSLQPRLL